MIFRRLVFSLILIVFGCLLAAWTQSGSSRVDVRDVRFIDANGQHFSGLLYVPVNATPSTPQPGILAVHGYINSRETQSSFAIELSRRGFVVLAMDMPGHGYSGPPVMPASPDPATISQRFGATGGLAYLRSLPFVDPSRIGLEGHSMGGWAVQVAAEAMPDAYRAMVLVGSSTGTFGTAPGTATSPRNLLLIFSRYDEFSQLMWGTATAAGIVNTPKLKTLFGTDDTVSLRRDYGDASAGTARRLEMPGVTHPGDHLSSEVAAATVDWFERHLGVDSGIRDQIWHWKEVGTGMALLGLIMLIFPLVDMGLNLFGRDLKEKPRNPPVQPLWLRRAAFWLTFTIPVVTFFPLLMLAERLFITNAIFPQQITNGVMLWAVTNGLITLVLFTVWYLSLEKKSLARCGLEIEAWQVFAIFKVLLFMAVVFFSVLALANIYLQVDYRFWVIAFKSPSFMQAGLIGIYLVPFTLFFVMLSASLHGQLQLSQGKPGQAMWANGLALSGGFMALLLLQYLPLFQGSTLLIASQPLFTILIFQFIPVLLVVGMVSTYCYYRTGNVYLGAGLNGMLVTAYLVAGTATQIAPAWW